MSKRVSYFNPFKEWQTESWRLKLARSEQCYDYSLHSFHGDNITVTASALTAPKLKRASSNDRVLTVSCDVMFNVLMKRARLVRDTSFIWSVTLRTHTVARFIDSHEQMPACVMRRCHVKNAITVPVLAKDVRIQHSLIEAVPSEHISSFKELLETTPELLTFARVQHTPSSYDKLVDTSDYKVIEQSENHSVSRGSLLSSKIMARPVYIRD